MSSPIPAIQKARQSACYQKNKAHYRAKFNERRKRTTQWLEDYKKTVSCSRCPENHPGCITFHHIDPNTKEKEVGIAARNWSIPTFTT
jgi:DNA-binding transcriptional MocR family regulator